MSQLFSGKDKQQFICALETCQRHVPTLWRYRFEKFDAAFYQETMFSSGFFAVKRRAVFILWTKWIALVRGWRRDYNEERGGTLVVLPLLVIGC